MPLKELGNSGIYVLPADITRVEAKDAAPESSLGPARPPKVIVVAAGIHSEIRCDTYEAALALAKEIVSWAAKSEE